MLSQVTQSQLLDFFGPEFQDLFNSPVEYRLKKGDTLWNPGDEPDSLWFILEGLATTAIESATGASHLVQITGKGQALCLASLIKGEPYGCSSTAAMDLKAIKVPRNRFMSALAASPPPVKMLIGQLACQLCRSHLVQSHDQDPVGKRMAKLLVHLNEQFQGRSLPFNRRELAEMAGMSTETASRTLAPWERKGYIRSSRGRTQIRNTEELKRLCADPGNPD